MKSNFICGTLEGFYGRPWRLDQRLQLFEWMKEWDGMNTYMYAPKDDLYHRSKWRELYPEKELSVLKNLIQCVIRKNWILFMPLHRVWILCIPMKMIGISLLRK